MTNQNIEFIWASPECFPGFSSAKGGVVIDYSRIQDREGHEELATIITQCLECSNFSKEVRR